MAWYNAGTVSVANNSVDVTGVNTLWVDNVDAGQAFIGPDGFPYEIASITSATALKLRNPYRGATAAGQAYTIMPAQGYVMALARAAAELVQSFAGVRDGIGQGVFPAGSVATPGFRFDGDETTGITQNGPGTFAIVVNNQVVANFDVNGFSPERMLLGGGTAAETALGFEGDENTGLFREGDDKLGFATGGARRVLIDDQGRVKIGAGTAEATLDVLSTGVAVGRFRSVLPAVPSSMDGGEMFGLHLTAARANTTFSGSDNRLLTLGVNQSGGVYARAFRLDLNASDYLTLSPGASEKVRVLSNGNVGIGKIAPGEKLDVAGNIASSGAMLINSDNAVLRMVNANGRGWRIGTTTVGTTLGRLYLQGTTDNFATTFISGITLENGSFRPEPDNLVALGGGSARWSVVYSATGAINTSDERAKQEIGGIPDEWLDAWGGVEWCRYKFNDAVDGKGGDARWHVGLIAQRVRDAFAALDLDATEIGLLCYDEWEEEREPIMEERQIDTEIVVVGQEATGLFLANGEPHMRDITEDRPIMGMVDTGETRITLEAGNRWGLRYDECHAMEAAWQRRELARKDAAIAALETAVSTMAAQIDALSAPGGE